MTKARLRLRSLGLEQCAPALFCLALACSGSPDATRGPAGAAGTAAGGAAAGGGTATGGSGAATGGSGGTSIGFGGAAGSSGSSGGPSCSDAEKLVYLAGNDLATGKSQLWSFDPASLVFDLVGEVTCPGFGTAPPLI